MNTENNIMLKRNAKGSITEFGAALVVLIGAVVLPLSVLSAVPCKYLLCQGIVTQSALHLGHCSKPSQAQTLFKNGSWKRSLASAGIDVRNEKLQIIAVTSDGGKQYTYEPGQAFSKEWLPDAPSAKSSPFIYTLKLSCSCVVPLPLLKAPLQIPVAASCQWENLARDPKSNTLAYFIEE